MSRCNSCCSVLLLVGSAVVAGCGGSAHELETAPAHGTVTLDGQPVTEGAVVFTPSQGWPAKGALGPNGEFTLSTYEDDDGAIVGSHSGVVIAEQATDAQEHFERPPPEPVKWLVPERYAQRSTSGIALTIEPGVEHQIQIELFTQPQKQPVVQVTRGS